MIQVSPFERDITSDFVVPVVLTILPGIVATSTKMIEDHFSGAESTHGNTPEITRGNRWLSDLKLQT
jgi:hypothetical protein